MAYSPNAKLTRNDGTRFKYTLTWDRKSGYDDGTTVQWKVDVSGQSDHYDDHTITSLSKTATKYTFTIGDASDFYPNGPSVIRVCARVKIKKGSSWSSYGESIYSIDPPATPTVCGETGNSADSCSKRNKALFINNNSTQLTMESSSARGEGTSSKPYLPFHSLQWQSKLFPNCQWDSAKEFSNEDWKNDLTGSPWTDTTTSSKKDVQAKVDSVGSGNQATRAYRVRSRGIGGASDWIYAWHSFGAPVESTQENVTVPEDKTEVDEYSQTLTFTIGWNFDISGANIPDYIAIEYYIGVPRANLMIPVGASFTEYAKRDISGTGKSYAVANKKDEIRVVLNRTLEKDQCCWARVSAYKEGESPSYGVPQLVLLGRLQSPTVNEFTADETTHRITVTATNNSQVEDSFVCIVYHDDIGSADDGLIIGVVPHGKSGQAMTFQAPNWTELGANSIGVEAFAVAGANVKSTTREDGVTVYELSTNSGQFQTTEFQSIFDGTKVSCTIYLGDFYTLGNYVKIISKAFEVYYTDGSLVPSSNYQITTPSAQFPQYTIVINDTDPTRYSKAIFKYTLNVDAVDYMISERNSDAETVSVPKAPTNVKGVLLEDGTTIQVTWDMTWTEADGSEVSWADHEDAWYSTAAPSTFEVPNIQEPKLNIADVTQGTHWYIRVRLYKVNSVGNKVYSSYGMCNDGYPIPTTFAPDVPTLTLSKKVIPETGSSTASWVYVSNDTTPQEECRIAELVSGTPNVIATVKTAQHIVLKPSNYNGWVNGTVHQIVAKVFSESGRESEWSEPKTLKIAPLPTCNITQFSPSYVDQKINSNTYTGSSLSFNGGTAASIRILSDLTTNIDYTGNIINGCTITFNGTAYDFDWSDKLDDFYGGTLNIITGVLSKTKNSSGTIITPVVYTITPQEIDLVAGTNTASSNVGDLTAVVCDEFYRGYLVTEIPFTYTVTGAGSASVTNVSIYRDQDFSIYKPDDDIYYGAYGETVYSYTYTGEGQQTINLNDLYTNLNDGCRYVLVATVADDNDQIATDEREFLVNWAHQAIIPNVNVRIENGYAFITPVFPDLPSGADEQGYEDDFIDIYRLSADQPELIYRNASFRQIYVDPYPTIGKEGGYRIVYRTLNGDYTTAGNVYAWRDVHIGLDTKFQLIDYGGTQIEFKYNIKLKNSWSKKFTKVTYLGGSTKGYWDSAVDVSNSVDGNVFYDLEPETYEDLRDLGMYSGICHLRTIDGTNITCNINVSDSSQFNSLEHQHDVSLTIDKIDNPELDGMTYADWVAEYED